MSIFLFFLCIAVIIGGLSFVLVSKNGKKPKRNSPIVTYPSWYAGNIFLTKKATVGGFFQFVDGAYDVFLITDNEMKLVTTVSSREEAIGFLEARNFPKSTLPGKTKWNQVPPIPFSRDSYIAHTLYVDNILVGWIHQFSHKKWSAHFAPTGECLSNDAPDEASAKRLVEEKALQDWNI